MIVKLVFDRWKNLDGSDPEEYVRYELSGLHGGSTFNTDVELDGDDENTMKEALDAGYQPHFYVFRVNKGK